MADIITINGKHNQSKVFTDELEPSAAGKIKALCDQSFAATSIRIMPDVHAGRGCTVGTTMTLIDSVVPNLVGVDIGCGMVAARLSITANDLDEKALKKVFDQITRDVPVGRGQHADD